MSENPEPRKVGNELEKRLRASLQSSRPRPLWGLMFWTVLTLLPVGFLVWWVYPRPGPPPLAVVAFDAIGLPAHEITLHAQLQAEQQNYKPVGIELVFEEAPVAKGTASPRQATVRSGDDGQAAIPWTFAAEAQTSEFLARYKGTGKSSPATHDRGRVYLLPQDSAILVVDVQKTLARATDAEWATKNIIEIPPRDGAQAALKAIAAKKYRIVYLAFDADSPVAYRKIRGWVENQGWKSALPLGPVLGRKSFAHEAALARREALQFLKDTFGGPIAAVVGDGETAAIAVGIGLKTIVLGDGPAPEEVRRAASWDKVPDLLREK
jgi:hypothetical protein